MSGKILLGLYANKTMEIDFMRANSRRNVQLGEMSAQIKSNTIVTSLSGLHVFYFLMIYLWVVRVEMCLKI